MRFVFQCGPGRQVLVGLAQPSVYFWKTLGLSPAAPGIAAVGSMILLQLSYFLKGVGEWGDGRG